MAIVEELLKSEQDGTISFGNHQLKEKGKKDEFAHAGDIYKVKTWHEITKLEKNGMFLYESVPGTSVTHFKEEGSGVSFMVDGTEDTQITVGLGIHEEYEVLVDGKTVGKMEANTGGKLSISVELSEDGETEVSIRK